MAQNGITYIKAEIKRDSLEELLVNLGKSLSQYIYSPLPEDASIDDFFRSFPEGNSNGKIDLKTFYVQARAKFDYTGAGRLLIGCDFESRESPEGILRMYHLDNGENVNQEIIDEIYSTFKKYTSDQGLKIIDEGTEPEF